MQTPELQDHATPAPASRWPVVIRAAIAAALLLLVFRVFANFGDTLAQLKSARPEVLLAGLAIALVGELVTAYKWRLLARHVGAELPISTAYRVSLIGMFFNNLLPGSVGGDVARLLLVARHFGGRVRAAASVFMQRNTGLGGLLLVGNVACWLTWHSQGAAKAQGLPGHPGVWLAMVTAGYLGVNSVLVSTGLYRMVWGWIEEWPNRFGACGKVAGILRRLHEEVLPYRTYWLAPLSISVISQLVDCTLVYTAARALRLEIPYYLFLVAAPLVSVAALLPITINGIGLREIGYILLLTGNNVSREAAAGIGLIQFGYIAVLSAVGGVLVLAQRGSGR